VSGRPRLASSASEHGSAGPKTPEKAAKPSDFATVAEIEPVLQKKESTPPQSVG
jgi:hypothetical protein